MGGVLLPDEMYSPPLTRRSNKNQETESNTSCESDNDNYQREMAKILRTLRQEIEILGGRTTL